MALICCGMIRSLWRRCHASIPAFVPRADPCGAPTFDQQPRPVAPAQRPALAARLALHQRRLDCRSRGWNPGLAVGRLQLDVYQRPGDGPAMSESDLEPCLASPPTTKSLVP